MITEISSTANPDFHITQFHILTFFKDFPYPPWNVMRTQTAFRAIEESFKSKTQLSDDILRRLNNFC